MWNLQQKKIFIPCSALGIWCSLRVTLSFEQQGSAAIFLKCEEYNTTRYSVIFQKFPSRVRVVQKNPSSIRVAGTRWTLFIGTLRYFQVRWSACRYSEVLLGTLRYLLVLWVTSGYFEVLWGLWFTKGNCPLPPPSRTWFLPEIQNFP